MGKKNMLFHILAAFTIIIWGITLISTKILIFNGLSPAGIMLYRFVIAYAVLWIFYPRLPKVKKWKDEAIFFAAGLFGGTIYFLTENTAVGITNTSNVALIVTTAPLLTAFIANFTLKNEPLKRHTFLGSIIALGGVFLIVFNGNFILQLNPAGSTGQNLRLRQVGGEKVCQGEQGLGQGFHRVLIQETGPTGGDHHRVHYDVGRLIGPKAAGDGLDERGGGDHTDLHRVRGNVSEHRVNLLL